jgi:hypothetical protein
MNFFVTICTLDYRFGSLPNRFRRSGYGPPTVRITQPLEERTSSSNEQNDQDDQEDSAKPTTDIRAADVEAAATSHKHQDDN